VSGTTEQEKHRNIHLVSRTTEKINCTSDVFN